MRNLLIKYLFLVATTCLLGACGGEVDREQVSLRPVFPAAPLMDGPKFGGNRDEYRITRNGDGYVVTDRIGNNTSISSLTTHIRFDDVSVNLQISDQSKTIPLKDLNSLIELYVAFFNRVPDADGLSYWIEQRRGGMDFDAIAQSFYSAAVQYSLQTGYSVSMTNDDFVKVIYKNVLGRSGSTAPPEADVQYWANELKNGRSKASMVAVMLNAAHSFTNDPVWSWVPSLLDNKIAVGRFFAVDNGLNYITPEDSIVKGMAIAAAVTANDISPAKALIPHDLLDANNSSLPFFTIETLIGGGTPDLGDGKLATDAVLMAPERVIVSSTGLLYVVDTNNDRIRTIDTNGVIGTVAGTSSAENQALGDGGAAIKAAVRFPRSLVETANGIFIGDHSYTVRFVDKLGKINHFALERFPVENVIYPWALAADASGNVYIADRDHHRILRADPKGNVIVIAGTGNRGVSGDGGLASLANIDTPSDLHFDGESRLLIGSPYSALRQIDLQTGLITTRAPQAMQFFHLESSTSALFTRGNQVLRANLATGVETVVAGSGIAGFFGDGGSALNAQFNHVQGVSVDQSGNILLADSGNNRIRKIQPNGIISTIAGNGKQLFELGSISDTQGIGIDRSGNLYFSDFQNHYIRRFSTDKILSTVAGTGVQQTAGDGDVALSAAFSNPVKILFDASGQLLFLDMTVGTAAVRMITPGSDGIVNGGGGEIISTIAGRNVSRDLADHGKADGGAARNAVFMATRYFLLDSQGNLIISDWMDHRIRKVTPGKDKVFNGGADEVISTIAGTGVADLTGDGGLASSAAVEAPTRMAIDSKDNLYVYVGVNTPRNAIRRIDSVTQKITTIARNIELVDMLITPYNELIYSTNTQVIALNLDTMRKTVIAGTGESGFSGDGGDARLATFVGASYLALDGQGRIYVADNGNFRIRRLNPKK